MSQVAEAQEAFDEVELATDDIAPALGRGDPSRNRASPPSKSSDAQGSPNCLRYAGVSWRMVQQSFAYAMSSSVDCQTRHTLTSVS